MEKDQLNFSTVNENPALLNLHGPMCSLCGEDHDTEHCSALKSLKPIPDTKTVSRARLTLPSNLEIRTLADGSTTVIALTKFDQGTQFGPFQAPLSLQMHPAVSFPLKVFPENSRENYYLDTTDEESCNWMCLVAAATSSKQQNLICYDIKQSIYFTTIRDIFPGEELRVWYALYYGLKLHALPLSDDSPKEDELWDFDGHKLAENIKLKGTCFVETLAQQLPAHTLGAACEKDSWNCRMCGSKENNVASFARHLMAHHRHGSSLKKFQAQCEICSKRFLNEKALTKHKESRHYSNIILSEVSIAETPHHSPQILMVVEDSSERNQCSNLLSKPSQTDVVSIDMNNELLLMSETDSQSKKLMSLASISSVELQNLSNASCASLGSKSSEGDSSEVVCFELKKSSKSEVGSVLHSTSNFDMSEVDVQRDSDFFEESTNISSGETFSNTDVIDASDSAPKIDPGVVKKMYSFHKEKSATEREKSKSDIILNATSRASLSELSFDKTDTDNDSADLALTSSTAELSIHTEDGVMLPTAYSLCEAQNIKLALESGEPVAFILVNPDPPEDADLPAVNSNSETECNHHATTDQDLSLIHIEEKEDFFVDADGNEPDSIGNNDLIPNDRRNKLTFNCDICDKSFEKSTYLYRHLRKHTGEFTCVTCLAVFARKENLQSHSCTRPMVRYPCPSCGKKFSSKKYLQRHIPLHTGEFTCHSCKRQFVSRISLAAHHCSSGREEVKDIITCFLCQRLFLSQVKLQAHLRRHYVNLQSNGAVASNNSAFYRTHSQRENSTKSSKSFRNSRYEEDSSSKDFVCEVCGATFKSCSSMKTHKFLHEERRFECEVCKKRFHRKDVLQDHLTVHQEAQLPCHMCGKKYKTKKSLYVHMAIHNGSKRFTCDDCGKEFFQKGNLLKHQHTHATERAFPCHYCKKKFTSKEYFNIHVLEHTQGKIFNCDVCRKSFVKKHLLESHHQLYHSNRGFLCKFCNSVMRHRHSARRHLEMRHNDHREEWIAPNFLDCLQVELPDCILHPAAEGLQNQTTPQHRQKLLQSLREKHFKDSPLKLPASINEDLDSTSDFLYTIVPPSDYQVDQLAQGDPLVMLQPTKQLTIFDNYPSDSSPQPSVSTACVPSNNVKESEIHLLTMVEPAAVPEDSQESSKQIPSAGATSNGQLTINSDTTYIMEDEAGNSSVFYYVVETGTTANNTDVDVQ